MGLENVDVIDAVGTETEDGTVVLSIIDGWDWADERQHLLALQDKMNAYFAFVESGQIYATYPDANGRSLRIDVIGRHSLPEAALALLDEASAVAAHLNIAVAHRTAG